MNEPKKDFLTNESKTQIDHWVAKFPADKKRSAVLAALHIAQKQNKGWLNEDAMNAVAAYLGLPNIAVYEVATFYSMYDLKPVGKHKICVCTNISCMLRGSEEIMEHLEKKLNIKAGETTLDGQFTLREVECLASCGTAPAMLLDDQYYENLTTENVDQILKDLVAGG
jgi:NADH-quinone oxidoreductase subunit E